MAIDLFMALLVQVHVQVLNADTGDRIGPAQVVMEGPDPPPRQRITRPDGQISFDVICSDDIKFSARLPEEPRFPRPSARVGCNRLVTLKVRPARGN